MKTKTFREAHEEKTRKEMSELKEILVNIQRKKDMANEEITCQECGELWNSEYHASDVCINLNEDKDE